MPTLLNAQFIVICSYNQLVLMFSKGHSEPRQLKALILAGGMSIRMGSDKSQLTYHSQTQELHTANLCHRLGLETYISKGYKSDKDFIGSFPIIKDQFKNLGPLAAILSAFSFDSKSAWLILACDLPFLNEDVIKTLLEKRQPEKLATCIQLEKNDFPEPLVAIYEPEMYPISLAFYSNGGSSPRQLLKENNIHSLSLKDELPLTNVNTIMEKVAALKMLEKQ